MGTAPVQLVLQLGKLRVPFPVWLYGAFILWAFVASLASPYADIALDKVLADFRADPFEQEAHVADQRVVAQHRVPCLPQVAHADDDTCTAQQRQPTANQPHLW